MWARRREQRRIKTEEIRNNKGINRMGRILVDEGGHMLQNWIWLCQRINRYMHTNNETLWKYTMHMVAYSIQMALGQFVMSILQDCNAIKIELWIKCTYRIFSVKTKELARIWQFCQYHRWHRDNNRHLGKIIHVFFIRHLQLNFALCVISNRHVTEY